MKRLALLAALPLPLLAALAQEPAPALAAPAPGPSAVPLIVPAGSTAFCPFALPGENGTQRSINLGIVQYIDLRADEVKIAFGGGNLGSGHEARIPVKSRDEAELVLARLRQTAARCAQATSGGTP